MILIAMLKVLNHSSLGEDIVFSAYRFGEKLGNVYQLGAAHLYRIHSDGTGLQKLTSGSMSDRKPRLSPDRKRLIFWRCAINEDGYENGPYHRMSMATDGSGLVDTKQTSERGREPEDEFMLAKWGQKMLRRKITDLGNVYTFYDKSGKPIFANVAADFCPNGSSALVRTPDGKYGILKLPSGKEVMLDNNARVPAWIDDDTVVVMAPDRISEGGHGSTEKESGQVKLLNSNGHLITYMAADFGDDAGGGLLPNLLLGRGYAQKLWDKQAFLWVAHRSMSDGGFDIVTLVDLKSRHIRFVSNCTIEAVSSDGLTFVGSEYRWIGGYKGIGAKKLGQMSVWNAKTLTHHPVGFRRMICTGACFVPGGSK